MKKLTLITAILLIAICNNFAQTKIEAVATTVSISQEFQPYSDSIMRIEFDLKRDTAHIYYYVVRFENGKEISRRFYRDCYVPYKDADLDPFRDAFKAWVKEQYSIIEKTTIEIKQ